MRFDAISSLADTESVLDSKPESATDRWLECGCRGAARARGVLTLKAQHERVGCLPGGSAELWTMEGGEHVAGWIPSGPTTSYASHVTDWLLRHPRRPGPEASFTVAPESGLSPLEVTVDGTDISDAIYLLIHLFAGGAAPAAPFPACGLSLLPADDELGCRTPPQSCHR